MYYEYYLKKLKQGDIPLFLRKYLNYPLLSRPKKSISTINKQGKNILI